MSGTGAIGTYEALAHRQLLERATTELKASPLFARFSRRLLFDLVERNGLHVLHELPLFPPLREPPDEANLTRPGPFLAIVVLDGTALATDPAAVALEKGNPPPPVLDKVPLQPGVYLRSGGALNPFVAIGRLQLSAKTDTATVVAVSAWTLEDSPTAAWSLDLNALEPRLHRGHALSRALRPEQIWVSAEADCDVPLEAAMHILGASVARQTASDLTGGAVRLRILGAPPTSLIWNGKHFVSDVTPEPRDVAATDRKRDRTFVGDPRTPFRAPPNHKFDRVVHLTRTMPSVLPTEIAPLLRPGLRLGEESTFCSFIASVLTDYDPPAPGCLPGCSGAFEARPLPSGAVDEPAMRPYRDSCTLRVDRPRLEGAWRTWIPNGHEQFPPFADVAVERKAVRQETNERWARAVTNRRVGFALSGGGASAYRAGPLLKRIDTAGIPIDVFAALSGGALVGAFCCGAEPDGFRRVTDLAPFFQLTLPGVMLWTWPYEAVVDALLGGTRVEDLERRFAAVAVSLPEASVPQVTVVVRGTLGEAARVSGALPPSFAPATKNWTRYTDGGAGTLVPARVARECGADVVLACNAIPGPSRGNPYSALPGAAWLLRWTPFVGRTVDSYTWHAFFNYQASKEFGRNAEAFVDFEPQSFPLFESTAFIAAPWIVACAEREGAKLDKAVETLRKKWDQLSPPLPPPPPLANAAPPAGKPPGTNGRRGQARRTRGKRGGPGRAARKIQPTAASRE